MKFLSNLLRGGLMSAMRHTLAFVAATILFVPAAHAIEVAVTFRDAGYGGFGGSQLQNISSPNSILGLPGVSKIEFVQDTASGRFEALTAGCDSQGNDVAVTVRLTVDPDLVLGSTDGTLSFTACVNWLDQPGGKIEGFGFMLPLNASYSIDFADETPSVVFTRTAASAGTNFFADLTVSGGSRTYLFDGTPASSFIGSANFKTSALVDEMNTYFAAQNPGTPQLSVTKTAVDSDASVSGAKAGDTIDWTVTAKNTGSATLTYSGFTDSLAETKTYQGLDTDSNGSIDSTAALTGSSVLMAGETWVWTVRHAVTQTEVDAGKIENVAHVAVVDAATSTALTAYSAANGVASVAATAPATGGGAIVQLPPAPAIEGVKTAAISTDVAPVGLSAGDTVTYTVTAKNIGTVTLTGVSVQSDTLKQADLTPAANSIGSFSVVGGGSTTLAPGASVGFTATYRVAQADIDAGGLSNTATVAGTPPTGSAVTDVTDDGDDLDGNTTNDQTVLGIAAAPAMTVTKTADASALSVAPLVGEVIDYTITVANSGNVSLTNIVLADALTEDEGYVSGDTGSDGVMGPGEVWTYAASYAVQQADIDAGKVDNLAIASATPPSGSGDRFSVESSAAAAGNAVAGEGEGAATETALTASPAMTVTKTADASALSAAPLVGEVIDYTITVANSGNVSLTNIVLADALTEDEGYVSGDTGSDGVMGPGEVWTYAASYAVQQADIDAGKVDNLAIASATPPSGSGDRFSVESSAAAAGNAVAGEGEGAATETALTASPAMTVTKTADASALSAAPMVGEVIDYTITVANSGNVSLTNIVLADALTEDEGYVSGDTGSDGVMGPGEVWTYAASYAVQQADIDAGKVDNLAIASATPPSGSGDRFSVESSAAAAGNAVAGEGEGAATETALTASPAMTVTKTADASALSAAPMVGEVIDYTITVANSGNVSLTNIVLADALTEDEGYVSGDTGSDGVMGPGEVWTYAASYAVQQADIDAGKVDNLAIASATPPSGSGDRFSVESSAAAAGNAVAGEGEGAATETALAGSAGLTVKKTVDDSALYTDGVRIGDTLLYTIEVKNTGNVTLTGVTLQDDFSDAAGGHPTLTSGPAPTTVLADDTLDPGEVWTFTASFALDAATIAAGGVENIATVTGTPPSGPAISAQSKVGGNSTANGVATTTGFPGEISGTVRTYLQPRSGVTVYLLIETSPGVYDYLLEDGVPRSVVTGEDGSYSFTGLPPGNYGVEFASDPSAPLTAISTEGEAASNRITELAVEAGAVEVHQDAYFIDPSGVVYDSETFAPLAGAVVTLEYNGAPVPDSWLNLSLGNPNGSTTGSDGVYAYVLDPTVAPSGVYRLRVVRSGYKASTAYPALTGALTPALGGGIEKVVPEDAPADSVAKVYYMSFDFTFVSGSAAATSNGIVNNHIPLDVELLPGVKDDVEKILRDDLAMTLKQQGRTMQGYAEGALKRLQSQDLDRCAAKIEQIQQETPIAFDGEGVAEGSAETLDRIAAELRGCPDSRFEVGVHAVGGSEARMSAEAAQTLTDVQAAAVLTELRARGVDSWQVVGRGYGAVAPEHRAEPRRVVFTLLDGGAAGGNCVNSSRSSHALAADAGETGRSFDGSFEREDRDCATASWKILSGGLRHMSSDRGMDQSMVTLSIRRERLVGMDAVRGAFLGAYATSNGITGTATGTILGFGVNAGLYGAKRISEAMYLDYYLVLAAGRHGFDLAFDRLGGVIDATGHYSYGALFAGAALSGEAEVGGLKLVPRAGVDLAWSPGGTGDLTVTRGLLEDTGSVTVPEVLGTHLYAELRIGDLLGQSPAVLAVTPGLFCDRDFGGAAVDCGLSARIDLSNRDERTGRFYALSLGMDRSARAGRKALS